MASLAASRSSLSSYAENLSDPDQGRRLDFGSVNCSFRETIVDKQKSPSSDMSAAMEQGIGQARGAIENYLKFFQKGMSAPPWANSELNKKLTEFTQQNLDSAFAHAQNLTHAKDLQDLMRIQTEYFQAQLRSLTEQAKGLGETATKAAASALKGPLNPSS